MLTCLAPWMENLSISSHWKGTWCERLLKSMYYLTLKHGSQFPFEIERLWWEAARWLADDAADCHVPMP